MKNLTYEDYQQLNEQEKELIIKTLLPIINVWNKHMISETEFYILLEYFVPLIGKKGLTGESLDSYLNWVIGGSKIDINNYIN